MVVESGATSKKEGEVTVNPPAQSPYTLCPERGPKKQLADTPFVEKEEAREVGLYWGSLPLFCHRSSHKRSTGKEGVKRNARCDEVFNFAWEIIYKLGLYSKKQQLRVVHADQYF